MNIVIEWEHVERRRATLEVPDDATPEMMTSLAVIEASTGRAGKMDTITADAIGHVSWTAPNGQFGGRVQ